MAHSHVNVSCCEGGSWVPAPWLVVKTAVLTRCSCLKWPLVEGLRRDMDFLSELRSFGHSGMGVASLLLTVLQAGDQKEYALSLQ